MRVLLLTARDSRDDGAIAVIVALVSIVILILAAFAVDIGNAYAQARQLSVAADADALAAAAAIGDVMPAGVACTPALLNSLNDGKGHVGAVAIARATANAMNTANSKSGQAEPVDSVTVTCASAGPSDTGTNAVEVRVDNGRPVPTYLAGMIGIHSIRPNSYAVAQYVRVSSASGLRPWAVCDQTVELAQTHPNTTYWTGIDGIVGPCNSTASGNWGSVDFDGGSNPANVLADWTLNGYPDGVTVPSTIPADPGVSNSSALRDAFSKLVGQVVLFPSVTGFTGGGGNNAKFPVVGIASVRICGIRYANSTFTTDQTTGEPSDCWVTPKAQATNTTSDTTTTTTTTAVALAKKDTTLKVSTASFPAPPVGAEVSVEVTIAGADGGGKDLTTKVATFVSTTEVTLAQEVKTDVAKGAKVTVKTTTSTSTTTPGAPDPQPGPFNGGNLIDHIQFRWVGYTTSSYSGADSDPCALSDTQCVGVTRLWQ